MVECIRIINYVKEEIFEKEYSKIIMEAFQIRNKSDYDDYFIASKNEAEEQLNKARKFVMKMKTYVIQESNKKDIY